MRGGQWVCANFLDSLEYLDLLGFAEFAHVFLGFVKPFLFVADSCASTVVESFFGKKQVFVVFDSFHESAIVFDIHENVGRLVSFDQNDWIVVGPLQQCGSTTIAELADWSKVIEYVKCACHDKPFLKPNFIPNYIPVLIPRFMVVRL